MQCPACKKFDAANAWTCKACGAPVKGGVVFVTSVSGSAADVQLARVVKEAKRKGHGHSVMLHDVGESMRRFAEEDDPGVNWARILDADPKMLRHLRARVFQDLAYQIRSKPGVLHIVDLHLTFRWLAYLTKGLEPHMLEPFKPHVRCFINLIEDLPMVQERLEKMGWGRRQVLELLIWRDEELFTTTLFADLCGRVACHAVANAEPPSLIERLIWHPEIRKVYLSFPITNLQGDRKAQREIEEFRDRLREFVVVFDPYACKDYDETYQLEEVKPLRKQLSEATVDRDFRFIDQADVVVVYYPRKVASKGSTPRWPTPGGPASRSTSTVPRIPAAARSPCRRSSSAATGRNI